ALQIFRSGNRRKYSGHSAMPPAQCSRLNRWRNVACYAYFRPLLEPSGALPETARSTSASARELAPPQLVFDHARAGTKDPPWSSSVHIQELDDLFYNL